jgi:hypothetical protein
MGKISEEELRESLKYLEDFEKGQETQSLVTKPNDDMDHSETTNGETSKLMTKHEQGLAKCIKKAKFHKEMLDKLKKGEDISGEEDLDEESEEEEEVNKSEKTLSLKKDKKEEEESFAKSTVGTPLGGTKGLEDLVKGLVASEFSTQKDLHAKEVESLKKGFEDRLKVLEDMPVQKSIIKGAQGVTLEKAFTDAKESGKAVLFAAQQPSKVSDALFKAFSEAKDEMTKGEIGNSIATFEASKYISPNVLNYMEQQGTVIM